MLMWGVLLVILLWALPTVWIGRQAQLRGRSELLWAALGGGAGVAGCALGGLVVYRWLDSDAAASLLAVVMLLPVALMFAGEIAVGTFLRSRPISVRRGTRWKVHVVGRGEGTL